jgi:multicomponent K+:H+ antiporter subunit A
VYSLRFSVDVSSARRRKRQLPLEPHEPVRWMRVPIEMLVLLCIVVGIFPQWSIGPALDAGGAAGGGRAMPPYSLAIWHGFNKPLVMSLIALGAASRCICCCGAAWRGASSTRRCWA